MIQVTKAVLPPLDAFVDRLRDVWRSGQLTNHGPFVEELEAALRARLGVRHCLLACNGTVALQLAIRALRLQGEVVTTPFSYVATTSSLVWEGCRVAFADIDHRSLCLAPELVAAACTEATSGILATHVYGNACDVEALSKLARERGLRLLFDCAHGFDARLEGVALAKHGDAAVLSFHATKLFHTAEGGAVVTNDDEVADRVRLLRNFGHQGQEAFAGLGINGKLSELHAALGLGVLPLVGEEIARRRALSEEYDARFSGAEVRTVEWRPGLERNYAYYPVLFDSAATVLRVRGALNEAGVFPRRYFYPPLHRLPYVTSPPMPVAESAAERVLCLPMGGDVSLDDAERIAAIVRRAC